MRTIFLSVLGTGLLLGGAAAAQSAPQEAVGLPLLSGMAFDDTCGPRPQYQGRAICVSGALASISPAADAYITHYEAQGWQVVAGEANGVVMARPRDAGGCDGLEMAAFYDETRAVGPSTQAWLAFAPLPGDICAGTAAQ